MSDQPNDPVRVLLVDDHPIVRSGLRTISEIDPRLQIVGEAATLADARTLCGYCLPDVALLDIRLPDGSGIDFCAELKTHPRSPRVIFLTSFADSDLILAAMQAGGDGYLLKGNDERKIAEAIHVVMRGGVVFDPAMTRNAIRQTADARSPSAPARERLSPQETRVLCEVASGKTDKEVAQTLGLSPKTVRNYLDRVFEKLNVRTRTEAAVRWLKSP